MPDTKITALAAITTVDPAADVLPIVDISDTSMAASGTTKKITSNQILGAGGTATLASATITGALTVGTGANAAVLKASFLGGYSVFENSAGTGNPSITFNNDLDTGIRNPSANTLVFDAGGFEQYRIASSGVFTWSDGAGGTRMTLNSTGLGIGASPTQAILVSRTGAAAIQIVNSSDSINALFGVSTTEAFLTSPNRALVFNVAGSERLRIDTSGNVGVGVTPSAWNSSYKAVEILGGNINTSSTSTIRIYQNAVVTASGLVYKTGGLAASGYVQFNGSHFFQTAGVGTNANDPLSLATPMTLDTSGNLILISPSTPPTLTTNGQLTVNATSNTNLRFSYRGSDGVTRTANLTLA